MKPLICLALVLASLPALAQRPAARATCKGGSCRACKNCKYCAHCKKNGGSCSVCSKMAAAVRGTGKKIARR